MNASDLQRQLEAQALSVAIPMFDRRLALLDESLNECKRLGQDIYVQNVTEQIKMLEQDRDVLAKLLEQKRQSSSSPRGVPSREEVVKALDPRPDPSAWAFSAADAVLALLSGWRADIVAQCAAAARNYSNVKPGDICEVQAGDWQEGIARTIEALAAQSPEQSSYLCGGGDA